MVLIVNYWPVFANTRRIVRVTAKNVASEQDLHLMQALPGQGVKIRFFVAGSKATFCKLWLST
jgi:hypothetical protein